MDVLDESLLQFWRLMQQHAVNYIMVGGLAVNLHGYSRITSDIDVWLEDTVANRERLGLVMEGMGYKGINMVNLCPAGAVCILVRDTVRYHDKDGRHPSLVYRMYGVGHKSQN